MIKRARQFGFTLVELLVVMAIIALLMGLLFPVLSQVRAASKSVVCKSNLHGCAVGCRMYLDGNNDFMPPASR